MSALPIEPIKIIHTDGECGAHGLATVTDTDVLFDIYQSTFSVEESSVFLQLAHDKQLTSVNTSLLLGLLYILVVIIYVIFRTKCSLLSVSIDADFYQNTESIIS